MNILFMAYKDSAGIFHNLAEAINAQTDHKALTAVENYNLLGHEYDFKVDADHPIPKEVIKKADIIHINSQPLSRYARFLPGLDASKVKIIRHFHGTDLRRGDAIFEMEYDHLFVSTPDLLLYLEHDTSLRKGSYSYLPNLITDADVNIEKMNDFTVGHIPNTAGANLFRYWDNIQEYKPLIEDPYPKLLNPLRPYEDIKHTVLLRDIQSRLGFRLNIAAGFENLKARRWIARTHVFFDQMFVGSYGVSAIEAMYAGVPVIAGIHDYCWEYYNEIAPCPILRCDENTLEEQIIRVRDMSLNDYWNLCEATKEYYKTVHGNETVVNQYIKTLEALF